VPLSVLAADAVQALLAPAALRAARRPTFVTGRPARAATAVLLLMAALLAQRAAYRQLRGAKATYGTVVDFVAASKTPDGQVVTDVWWLDQLAAAALDGQNVLYAGDTEVGRAIVRRLHALALPTLTLFRSREEFPEITSWSTGTCYVEEARDQLETRGLIAVRLRHRCDSPP
jgi:hypothetical protein